MLEYAFQFTNYPHGTHLFLPFHAHSRLRFTVYATNNFISTQMVTQYVDFVEDLIKVIDSNSKQEGTGNWVVDA